MSIHTTTHEGLNRVHHGAEALRRSVGPARGMRVLPVVVLTAMTAAVVVIADRVYAILSNGGFASEWLAMWLLSTAAVLLLGKAALAASRWLVRSERGLVARWQEMRAEAEIARVVAFDPRMAVELRVARDRAES